MNKSKEIEAFLELVRAGLWEHPEDIIISKGVDFSTIYRIAEEQTVIGLIAAGLEIVNNQNIQVSVPQEITLQFVGTMVQIEQTNVIMNSALAQMVKEMKSNNIFALLVKGQGIAQCYGRPLWRSSGDFDFLLSEDNYRRAGEFFKERASRVDEEDSYSLHKAFCVDGWEVELHGSLRNRLGKRVDRGIDQALEATLKYGEVRVWNNNGTEIYLPAPNNDVIFVFTHILGHFFRGGIGLRQICDWCRLLWTFRHTINCKLLKKRLTEMGLLSEWKVFGTLAVDSLGMPLDAMPFYSNSRLYKWKANQVLSHIIETGNMGHNRDMSYYSKHSFLVKKIISLWRHTNDGVKLFFVFPLDSLRVWLLVIKRGITVAFNNIKAN